MKVALVYDRVNKWGGAERLLLALHEIFPHAPLYTSVYSPKKAPWADVFRIKTSFLQKFPFSTHHELYAPLMPLAFESFNFNKYDLVISVTSEAAKGIITTPQTKHICYMLTPTRYLWSGYKDYFKNEWLRLFALPLVAYLRFWDKAAAQRPDKIIAISEEVRSRIKRYYKRDSKVIYPPLTLGSKYQVASIMNEKIHNTKYIIPNTGFYLIVSRLVPYKRIDIAIKAFNALGLTLKIVGTGSESNKLKRMAKSNIEFLGNLTDEELVKYYKKCVALVFPGKEDFGLTVLEAQSFGKPVIAYEAGGVRETVAKGKTGMFFYPQTEKALTEGIKKFQKSKFDPAECKQQAKKFAIKNFKKRFLQEVENLN